METPDVLGIRVGEARLQLEDLRLEFIVRRERAPSRVGQVIEQFPAPGTVVEPGATLTVTVGAPNPVVPPVTFDSVRRATARLKADGYRVRVVIRSVQGLLGDLFGPNTVIDYRPKGRVRPGRVITLFVSPRSSRTASSECHDSYTDGCVPIASDVDCGGGSGNGPAYVWESVTVIGTDVYRLDDDGDGTGCDSLGG